ncbi:MAG TPA: hypothetical protein VGM44_20305 [Polyangiaceae bacterium]
MTTLAAPGRAQVASNASIDVSVVSHSIPRTGFRLNDQINYADCRDGDVISFPLTLTNRGSYQLEAWTSVSGVDCGLTQSRTGQLPTPCWKLFSATPGMNLLIVSVHVRDILAGFFTDLSSVAPGALISGTGIEACTDGQPLSFVTPFNVTFLLVDPSDASMQAEASWSGTFKISGPQPPNGLGLVKGDGALDAHFFYSGNTGADVTLNGYQFYCDPPPNVAVDAGTAPDGGALDCADSLTTTTLVPGQVPDGLEYNQCATADRNATSAKITDLANGIPYRVAMAAVDTYSNIGPLSMIACGMPLRSDQEVKACSFSPRPVHSSLGWFGLVASGCWLGRRRNRRTSRGKR